MLSKWCILHIAMLQPRFYLQCRVYLKMILQQHLMKGGGVVGDLFLLCFLSLSFHRNPFDSFVVFLWSLAAVKDKGWLLPHHLCHFIFLEDTNFNYFKVGQAKRSFFFFDRGLTLLYTVVYISVWTCHPQMVPMFMIYIFYWIVNGSAKCTQGRLGNWEFEFLIRWLHIYLRTYGILP